MNTFIAVPRKYVRWVRDPNGSRTTYTYVLPEVEEFLRENEMNTRAVIRDNWINSSFGVYFENEEDAVIFKLTFL
jgi:nitrous oxidase accessory protein NosD